MITADEAKKMGTDSLWLRAYRSCQLFNEEQIRKAAVRNQRHAALITSSRPYIVDEDKVNQLTEEDWLSSIKVQDCFTNIDEALKHNPFNCQKEIQEWLEGWGYTVTKINTSLYTYEYFVHWGNS